MKVDTVDRSAFSLAIACGPFTPDSDLSYAPLASLVETLKEDKPGAVLLVRSFACLSHSKSWFNVL